MGGPRRSWHFEFDLNTSDSFGEEVGESCISGRRTSIGKGMEVRDVLRLERTLGA